MKKKKSYKKIHRAVNRFYPWDFGFVLDIEKKCLEEMRDYLGTEGIAVGNDRDAERINTAIKCLNIFNDAGFNIDKKTRKVMSSNYVNTKNYRRFLPGVDKTSNRDKIIESGSFKVSIREQKAWHLYNMIREYFMQQWWD